MTRNVLARVARIVELLKQGKYPNCSTLARELEVSSKTVARDLDMLRYRMNAEIEFDAQHNGYYLAKPMEGIPFLSLSSRELFAVCVVQKALDHYRGTTLEKPLEMGLRMILERLDADERVTLQGFDEALSFRPFAPDDPDLAVFALVSRAVTERQVLRFFYRKPGQKKGEWRLVRPYHLTAYEGRWYLVGDDVARKDWRTFVLGRMQQGTVTGEGFERRPDFDVQRHFDRSLGVMRGAGDYRVVIEMDAWLTDVLRGRRWHPSTEVSELPGGGSRLRMRLSGLEEIEQQVLSWGTHATVVEPEMLRERVGAIGYELAIRYRVLNILDGPGSGTKYRGAEG